MARNIWIFLILFLFVAVQVPGLSHVDNSDENVYFYMSSLVAHGELPYRDFFYAHPPLELFVGALVFLLFGFNLVLLKLVPLAATAVSGFLVYKIASEYFGELAAVFSAVLFLFSYRVAFEATYFMGLNLAIMFLLLGFYFMSRKPHLSGLFFALAAATRLLVIIPVIILLAFMLSKNLRRFLYCSAVFAAVFLLMNAAFFMLSRSFFVSVYKFHLLKPAVESVSFQLLVEFISQNFLLWLGLLLAFVYWNKKLALFSLISAACIIFILALARPFNFYFLVAMPFMSIMAGVAADVFAKKLNYNKWVVVAIFSILVLSGAYVVTALWQGFDKFDAAYQMSDFVRQNSMESDLMFGDVNSVPLVALMSGRKIMNDIVDTNEMVYLSGVRSLDQELTLISSSRPKFVIIRPLYGIGSLKQTQNFLESNCLFVRDFKDPGWSDFLLYDCSQA